MPLRGADDGARALRGRCGMDCIALVCATAALLLTGCLVQAVGPEMQLKANLVEFAALL